MLDTTVTKRKKKVKKRKVKGLGNKTMLVDEQLEDTVLELLNEDDIDGDFDKVKMNHIERQSILLKKEEERKEQIRMEHVKEKEKFLLENADRFENFHTDAQFVE